MAGGGGGGGRLEPHTGVVRLGGCGVRVGEGIWGRATGGKQGVKEGEVGLSAGDRVEGERHVGGRRLWGLRAESRRLHGRNVCAGARES